MRRLLQKMASHYPREPHCVDPIQQGKSLGSALPRQALIRCDREQRLAYLESSNAKNIPLYERAGFERIGTIQAGTWPPLYPMVRARRLTERWNKLIRYGSSEFRRGPPARRLDTSSALHGSIPRVSDAPGLKRPAGEG